MFLQADDAVTIFFNTHFCAATNVWKAHKHQQWWRPWFGAGQMLNGFCIIWSVRRSLAVIVLHVYITCHVYDKALYSLISRPIPSILSLAALQAMENLHSLISRLQKTRWSLETRLGCKYMYLTLLHSESLKLSCCYYCCQLPVWQLEWRGRPSQFWKENYFNFVWRFLREWWSRKHLLLLSPLSMELPLVRIANVCIFTLLVLIMYWSSCMQPIYHSFMQFDSVSVSRGNRQLQLISIWHCYTAVVWIRPAAWLHFVHEIAV